MKKGLVTATWRSVNVLGQVNLYESEVDVAYKGSAADIVFQMISVVFVLVWAMLSCQPSSSLHWNAQFVEVSGAGLKESHPHDVSKYQRSTKLLRSIKKSVKS